MNNFHKFQNFRQFSNLSSQIWLKIQHTSLFSGICREIRTTFHQKFSEKMKILTIKMKKIRNSIFQSRKNVGDFWLKFWDWRTVQRSALCRSRRELSNEYLLAKSDQIKCHLHIHVCEIILKLIVYVKYFFTYVCEGWGWAYT